MALSLQSTQNSRGSWRFDVVFVGSLNLEEVHVREKVLKVSGAGVRGGRAAIGRAARHLHTHTCVLHSCRALQIQ